MKPLANAGLALVGALERVRLLIAPVANKALDKITGPRIDEAQARAAGMAPFEVQADAAMSQQATYRANRWCAGPWC